MHLSHSVRIDRPAVEVFEVLSDLGRAVPCLPGVRTVRSAADGVTGTLDVRLGRLPLSYTGRVQLLAVDSARRRLTVRAKGKEQAGNGDTDAYLTALVRGRDGGAELDIDADLGVRGAAAVFGHGALAELAADLAAGFAENLTMDLDRVPVATGPVERRQPTRHARIALVAAAAVGSAMAVGLGIRAVIRRRQNS